MADNPNLSPPSNFVNKVLFEPCPFIYTWSLFVFLLQGRVE
jgi:hypothetical protein